MDGGGGITEFYYPSFLFLIEGGEKDPLRK